MEAGEDAVENINNDRDFGQLEFYGPGMRNDPQPARRPGMRSYWRTGALLT